MVGKKQRKAYRCEACGARPAAWTGSCGQCGEWGTIVESSPRSADAPAEHRPLAAYAADLTVPVPTGVEPVDVVLGGGLVPGSVTLLGGEPGIGKSTLTLQIAGSVARSGAAVVLAAGEESAAQIAGRAHRLGEIPASLAVVESVDVAEIEALVAQRPQLVVVDSIQTVRVPDATGAVGSVTQVREAADRLSRAANAHGVSLLLIGQVTKDGSLAGPRQLEHLVDTVLGLEGDRAGDLRHLRVTKHRFGPTDEIATLEMTAEGLVPVESWSERLLADRLGGVPGSVVAVALDGRRPCLVEVQALVSPSAGHPQRSVQGLAAGRVDLVTAVLGRRGGYRLDGQDLFVSVPGGERLVDAGLDLAVAVAIASALVDRAVPAELVCFGEIGLAGETRRVAGHDARLAEAYRGGFRRVVGPSGVEAGPTGLRGHAARTLSEALHLALPQRSEADGHWGGSGRLV